MSEASKAARVLPVGGSVTWAPAVLASLGVVFGDIGTSPLYAFGVAINAAGAGARFRLKSFWASCRLFSGR